MSVDGMISLPVALEAAVKAVEREPDFRILRRLPAMNRPEPRDVPGRLVRGVCLDVETTGLDVAADQVIELAMQSFIADEAGRIIATGESRCWLEDPGVEITPEITRVTGLRAADLQGRSISEGEATGILLAADVLVSHNAQFDRPFVERRLPCAAGMPWACSCHGIDWRGHGFEGRSLTHLCLQMGWFYDAHRASVDVTALLHLLDHCLPDGSTTMLRMLENARRPSWRIECHDAPRDARKALKKRGYRWHPTRRHWFREVGERERDLETEWATIRVYRATGSPISNMVDWTSRYALY